MSREPEKKRKTDRKVLGDLPPRVIVHEILVHHLLPTNQNSTYSKLKLHHFGIFTRDRLRNIWFIFSSVKVERRPWQVLDYRRIVCLRISCPEEGFINQMSIVSPKMRSILNIHCFFSAISGVNTLFSKENCFPNIQSLSLSFHMMPTHDIVVCTKTNIFQRIRQLSIDSSFSSPVSKEYETKVFSSLNANLESISLRNIMFQNTQKPFELSLPNLRKLCLNEVLNLRIHRTEKVQELRVEELVRFTNLRGEHGSIDLFESIYKRNRNIRVLTLRNYLGDRLNPLLFNPKWNPLKFVKKVKLNMIPRYEGPPNGSFGENIECLSIASCLEIREDLFFNREYKKLTRLELGHVPSPTREWKILLNVERLIFCTPSDTLESIFTINEETLSMKLKELVFLRFSGARGVERLLEDIVLKELRRLEYVEWNMVSHGVGLKEENLENLEVLLVERCELFDELGLEDRFPNVRIEKKDSQGWRFMREFLETEED